MEKQQNQNGVKKQFKPLPALIGTGGMYMSFLLRNPSNNNIFGSILKNNYAGEKMNPVIMMSPNHSGVLSTTLPRIFGKGDNAAIKWKLHSTKNGNLMVLADIELPEGINSAIFIKTSNEISVIPRFHGKSHEELTHTIEIDPDIRSLIEPTRLHINFVQLNELDFILSVQSPNYKRILMPNLKEEIELDPNHESQLGLIQTIWPELQLRYKTISNENRTYTSLISVLRDAPWKGDYVEFTRSMREPGLLKMIEVCPEE